MDIEKETKLFFLVQPVKSSQRKWRTNSLHHGIRFPAGFHTVGTAPWDQGSRQQEYQAKSYGAPARRATGVACRQDKSSSSRHRHLSAVQSN